MSVELPITLISKIHEIYSKLLTLVLPHRLILLSDYICVSRSYLIVDITVHFGIKMEP